ncbi:hypothetical protein [Mycolicibacterium porcinum]|uniref:hypothetical protein n=1 Tax=Mycolicibacterium porcinum TaxID=39693 RepID=UPI000AFFAD28|nr:hypothetical protein [Mycolicibacterium porcinum]
MTLPPPPGPYGSQPSGRGDPQWGGPPPQGPGTPPPHRQPEPWPPQQWGAQPPPSNGGKAKWILGGLAITLAIALAVVITVLVVRPAGGSGNDQQPNTAKGGSEFASANDTGPANIITEDPTCEAWGKISDGLVAAAPGWNDQDYSMPATDWTPEQRTLFEKKGASLTDAISSLNNITKQTPHRVMRELYEQYIAYSRAVINAIPTYSSEDNYIVAASNQLAGALNRICDSVYFRAAQQTAPLIAAPAAPSEVQSIADDTKSEPELFLIVHNDTCNQWVSLAEKFDKDSEPWRQISAKIPATEWTPDQKSVMDVVAPVMTDYSDEMEKLGRQSQNLLWEDFATLAAQYMRAYVRGIPTYTANIGYLASSSTLISNSIYWACKAAA